MHRVQHLMAHLRTIPAGVQVNETNAAPKRPVEVLVTGGAGNIAYAILFQIAQGAMLGQDQPINLRILDIPLMATKLDGVVMELVDGGFPLLHKITATTDYKVAFENIEVALLIGAAPRKQGMDRSDLLNANAKIFVGQGEALNKYAARNVKVLVVGNPANTNALITAANAPNLPVTAFTAMTRLDHQRMVGALSQRLNVIPERIRNVIVWGNHSNTQYDDVSHGTVQDLPRTGLNIPLSAAINNEAYVRGEFLKTVAERGGAIIKARGASSAASAAAAAVAHVRDWVLGTPEGEWVSMAVMSDGSYGVPKGLIFSFPCVCKNGQYEIVQNLPLSDFSKAKIAETTEELLSEKKAVGL